MYIYTPLGRKKISDLNAADSLLKLKEKSGNNPWPVIEKILEIWKAKNPTKWDSYLLDMNDVRETRKDHKFASTYDRETGGTLRYTMDVPQPVMFMIRAVYNPEELPMNREFFLEMARRFPIFKIADKL